MYTGNLAFVLPFFGKIDNNNNNILADYCYKESKEIGANLVVLSPRPFSPGWRLSIGDYKRKSHPGEKGLGDETILIQRFRAREFSI